MAEPPEGQINGGGAPPPTAPMTLTNSETTVGSKRQRRPSVRLGEIGGNNNHHASYDSNHRRPPSTATTSGKQFKHHNFSASLDQKKDTNKSKSRGVYNLSGNENETLDETLDSIAIGSWRVKDPKKRVPVKRVRSNWVTKTTDSVATTVAAGNSNDDNNGNGNNNNFDRGDSKYSDTDDGYREFNMENSDSPVKEQSPVHSLDNLAVDGHEREPLYYSRRGSFRGNNDGVELSGPSDNDVRDWNRSGSEDGVRIWLNSIGLGRYAPVFEIHEVDDEVLPMLTLEDLKDMGINAVGSRRKMYCAIQKLGKGFS